MQKFLYFATQVKNILSIQLRIRTQYRIPLKINSIQFLFFFFCLFFWFNELVLNLENKAKIFIFVVVFFLRKFYFNPHYARLIWFFIVFKLTYFFVVFFFFLFLLIFFVIFSKAPLKLQLNSTKTTTTIYIEIKCIFCFSSLLTSIEMIRKKKREIRNKISSKIVNEP